MDTSQEWCLDPVYVRNVLWDLANPDKESTIIIGPEVFTDKVRRALLKVPQRYLEESWKELWDEIYELWEIIEECSNEDISVCSSKILSIFNQILERMPFLESALSEVRSELHDYFEHLHNTYGLYFIVDWSRYIIYYHYYYLRRYFYRRRYPRYPFYEHDLLVDSIALGISLELMTSLRFLNIRKDIKSLTKKFDALIWKGRQWVIQKRPVLIVSWECIKKVASDTSKDKIIEDLLNQVIPSLGTAVVFTKQVIGCVNDEYIVVTKR